MPPDFDELYAHNRDPWRVSQSWYEQRKLGIVMAALRAHRYRDAWDPACGTGALVERLAARCDRVIAHDASAEATKIAAGRLAVIPNATVAHAALPESADDLRRPIDLLVLSEFAYYLPPQDLERSLDSALAHLADEAEVLSVHWRPHPHDAFSSGVEVTEHIGRYLLAAGLRECVRHDEPEFVLASWTQTGPA